MSVAVERTADEKQLIISISGRFDFHIHKDFRSAYADTEKAAEYVVDLKNTDYIDSAALGMLLQLREYAGNAGDAVSIINCGQEILNIFRIANFNKLFHVVP